MAQVPAPLVTLSGTYKTITTFDERFPAGAPSLRRATSLRVEGDWTFGADVRVVDGAVLPEDGGRVPDGATVGADGVGSDGVDG